MPFVKTHSSLLIAGLLTLAGCATSSQRQMLTSSEAVRLASAEIRKDGTTFEGLLPPHVVYAPKEDGGTWHITWDVAPDARGMVPVGGDLGASVEDKTRKVWVIPGR
jgi:hypothetical protein